MGAAEDRRMAPDCTLLHRLSLTRCLRGSGATEPSIALKHCRPFPPDSFAPIVLTTVLRLPLE
jgi:hypothetical protein